MIIWLTGLPCSGKTTLSKIIAERLNADILDGDELRNSVFSQGIPYTKEDREKHLLRVGYLAERLNKHVDVVCALVSPFEEARSKLPIDCLIYVKCPVEICEQRDVKGMYALARKGILKDFTGVSGPYEEPKNPDLVVDTSKMSIDQCVQEILDTIRSKRVS